MPVRWLQHSWNGSITGSGPVMRGRGDLCTPIARAFKLAEEAGAPTVEIRGAALRVRSTTPDRAEVETWLTRFLGEDPIWTALGAGRHDGANLAPVALAHLSDAELPSTNLLIPFAPSRGLHTLAELAAGLLQALSSRIDLLGDLSERQVLEVIVRPGPTCWLQLSAPLFFARLHRGVPPRCTRVRSSADGRLEFLSERNPAAEALLARLAARCDCNFEALLVEQDGEIQLTDLSITRISEESNTRLLAEILSSTQDVQSLLANCSPRTPPVIASEARPIGRGHAQGSRWATGPLATSLDSALEFAVAGRRPILIMDRLLPGEASTLERFGGLVLQQDGPASHITILARTLGLPVVTGLEGLRRAQRDTLSIGCEELVLGEIVSLNEADGGLYRGPIDPGRSPVAAIAAHLESAGANPVAITVGGSNCSFVGNGSPQRIGLCRSEMQILGSFAGPDLRDYLRRVAGSAKPEPIPGTVKATLRRSLDEVLGAAGGAIVNYRLMDADLGEVLGSTEGRKKGDREPSIEPARHASLRGPRWALASGFYDWQIAMAFDAAADALRAGPVDLVITLPSAFSLEEVRAVRAIFDGRATTRPEAARAVRFGVMIETLRLAAMPISLAAIADVFCFGLNDLTGSTFGIARNAWGAIRGYYAARGLQTADPFAALDPVGVAPVVRRAICRLRRAGARGPVFLCGEAASSPAAHSLAVREPNLHVSVGAADWASATVSCARERARQGSAIPLIRSPLQEATRLAVEAAASARRSGLEALAHAAALQWSLSNCRLANASHTQNWKVLKKGLVERIFGALEGRFFAPPWVVDEVVNYVRTFLSCEQVMRVSAFPTGISCHARSEIVDPAWTELRLASFFRSFEPDATLHVFPQQDADQMCFRAVLAEGEVLVEAGWGQAMYVFEAERGYHPLIIARASYGEPLTLGPTANAPERLTAAFHAFVADRGAWLQAVSDALPSLLGAEQVAIEGYFDPRKSGRLVVVDIDLPLDIAWNYPAR